MIRGGVLLLLVSALLPAQTEEPGSRAELERLARLSRTGSPVVRPQAARRLVSRGAPAAEYLREMAGPEGRQLHALGRDLIELLGRLDDATLRGWLWDGMGDANFPWRPAAARSLAETTRPERDEAVRFERMLDDRLAAVRAAALDAMENLDRKSAKAAVRDRLSDPHPRVRRRAASLLALWGERDALLWLIEELRREDMWFGRDEGRQGRAAAARALTRYFGPLEGFDLGRPPGHPVNRSVWLKARLRLKKELGALPKLPAVARAGRKTRGDVIGLELASCRVGELRLRWNLADKLYVGRGRAAAVDLPEGSVAELLAAAATARRELGGKRLFGRPGCDTEELSLLPDPKGRLFVLRVSKGPEPVPGLRPEALGLFFRRLVDSIPEVESADPRLRDLRERTLTALAAIGGPLPAAPR